MDSSYYLSKVAAELIAVFPCELLAVILNNDELTEDMISLVTTNRFSPQYALVSSFTVVTPFALS